MVVLHQTAVEHLEVIDKGVLELVLGPLLGKVELHWEGVGVVLAGIGGQVLVEGGQVGVLQLLLEETAVGQLVSQVLAEGGLSDADIPSDAASEPTS
jgi:hypothetical protein